MKAIIGIDLGTTFSAIAKLDDHGQPAVVPVDGERIMPSCVYSPRSDPSHIIVGKEALNELGIYPKSVVRRFKRAMGSDALFELESGSVLTPVAASAVILKKLAQEASKTVGPIRDVVITVPANFAERQRQATMAAGQEAGLNVLNIINEPTAAVLAYATQKPVNGTVMVYDLGGGTFDVTIAKVEGTKVDCLTSEGDSDLGGIDFDQKVAEIIDRKYAQKYGRSLREGLGLESGDDERNSAEWQSLLMLSETIKHSLSKMDTKAFVFSDGPDGPLRGEVSRLEFEQAISSLIARTEMRVETALDNLNLEPSDIDVILLVGGSTRVPAVRQSLKRLMGKEGSEAVNPDEAVALGAAIYAGLRTEKSALKPLQRSALQNVLVGDVANHFFGTIAMNFDDERGTEEERVTIILRKDTPIPCSHTERFFTRTAGQQYINFKLTQSPEEERDPEFVNVVHTDRLGPLPAGRESHCPVDFTYRYDEDQVMSIEILDVKSGQVFKSQHRFQGSSGSPIAIPDFRID
jgi:molecular chaperone DnaK